MRPSSGVTSLLQDVASIQGDLQRIDSQLDSCDRRVAQLEGRLSVGAAPAKVAPAAAAVQLDEPSTTKFETAAWIIADAMIGEYHEVHPPEVGAWKAFQQYHPMRTYSTWAIILLLVLLMFETPLWCTEQGFWTFEEATVLCKTDERTQAPIMSGLPMVPIGLGMFIEAVLLSVVVWKNVVEHRLETYFGKLGSKDKTVFYRAPFPRVLEQSLLVIGFLDLAYFMCIPSTDFRLAPYVRLALACSLRTVRKTVRIFWKTTLSTLPTFVLLAGLVVLFGWFTAFVFDHELNKKGEPLDPDLVPYSNSLYTVFLVTTGANLPDALIKTYKHSRLTVFFWAVIVLLGTCVLSQVVLAAVYSKYLEQAGSMVKDERQIMNQCIAQAFKLLAGPSAKGEAKDGPVKAINKDTFKQFTDQLNTAGVKVQVEFLRISFEAIDDDKSGELDADEFFDVCDMLCHTFSLTTRDSPTISHCPAIYKPLKVLCDNGTREEDENGAKVDMGYEVTYEGSAMDNIMNFVLAANVVFIFSESYVDLSNLEEPKWFPVADFFFTLAYVMEVLVKLSVWSWPHYWSCNDNVFDFITTMILFGGGVLCWFADFGPSNLLFFNIFRIFRVLKAVENIPMVRNIFFVIVKMVQACRNVILMVLLVMYIFSAVGVQLFGRELHKSNPKLEDSDWVSGDLEAFNFNDMFMSMVTLLFFAVTNYFNEVAVACFSLYDPWSFYGVLTYVYMIGFYFACCLLTFNVVTAFTIDIFNKAQDEVDKGEESEIQKNLAKIKKQLAKDKGQILRALAQAEASTQDLYKQMFDDDKGDDKGKDAADEKDPKGGDGQGPSTSS